MISLKKCKEGSDPHPMKTYRERLRNTTSSVNLKDRLGDGLLTVIKENNKIVRNSSRQSNKSSNNSTALHEKNIGNIKQRESKVTVSVSVTNNPPQKSARVSLGKYNSSIK